MWKARVRVWIQLKSAFNLAIIVETAQRSFVASLRLIKMSKNKIQVLSEKFHQKHFTSQLNSTNFSDAFKINQKKKKWERERKFFAKKEQNFGKASRAKNLQCRHLTSSVREFMTAVVLGRSSLDNFLSMSEEKNNFCNDKYTKRSQEKCSHPFQERIKTIIYNLCKRFSILNFIFILLSSFVCVQRFFFGLQK